VSEVSIRELRNRGGEVIERVVQGERLTVTRDGHGVAELRPSVDPPPAPPSSSSAGPASHPCAPPVFGATSTGCSTPGCDGPSERRGLLDTSTVILLGRLSASDLPTVPLIYAVTLAELSVGPLVVTSRAERGARQARLQQPADFEPLPFDADAARAFGRVAASLRESGRKVQARAYDAMIAAIAIANGLPLYTVNPSDFQGIAGLDLRAVPHPDE